MESNKLSLGDMPFEIHLLIFSSLDYPSTRAMKKTARYYYEALSISERFEPHIANAYLTCSLCCRVLLRSEFGNTQTLRKRCRGGPDAHKRFCIDCGLKHGNYGIGISVARGNAFWSVCRDCGTFSIRHGGRGEACSDCTPHTPP